MEQTIVFVYAKDGIIKALPLIKASSDHSVLVDNGWTHTHTIDACIWMESIHNNKNNKHILNQVNGLSVR